MRHRFGAPAILALSAILAVGCSSTAGSQAPATTAPSTGASTAASVAPPPSATPIPVEKVSVQLDFVISATSGPILWGIDKGYFTEQGIEMDLIPGKGSDLALNQIDSGKVDFAFIDGSNYIAARAKDLTKTTAIYALQNISTTAIASKVELKDPKDMVGKSFGTVAQSSGRQKIPLVLQQNGIDPAGVPIELMDFSVLYPTLFEGKIDTAEVGLPGSWEGALLSAKEQGLTLYVKLISDWGYRDYSKLLIVSDKAIAEKPDLVKRMVAALAKSQDDALANATPAQIFALVQAVDPQVEEEKATLEWQDVQQYIKNPGPMDDATFQFQLDVLKSSGTPSTLKPADLYTNEYIPAS
jgi:NitT/TauT family transport system substrate-binding protein